MFASCQDLIKLCAIPDALFPAIRHVKRSSCHVVPVFVLGSNIHSTRDRLIFSHFLQFRSFQTAEEINHRIMQTNWPINFSHWLQCTFWAGWGRRKLRTKRRSPQHFSFLLRLCFAEIQLDVIHMFGFMRVQHFYYDSESEAEASCNCARSNVWLTICTRCSAAVGVCDVLIKVP